MKRLNTAWAKRYKAMHDRVKAHLANLGKKNVVSYSAYKDDKRGLPVDNLDQVAIEGKALVRYDGWGEKKFEAAVENPTWLDLAVVANDAIFETEDFHHVFLEGVALRKKDTSETPVYELVMGS